MENIPQTLKESEMNDSPRDEKEENKNVQVVDSNHEDSKITYQIPRPLSFLSFFQQSEPFLFYILDFLQNKKEDKNY
jgi:hypothetical protein